MRLVGYNSIRIHVSLCLLVVFTFLVSIFIVFSKASADDHTSSQITTQVYVPTSCTLAGQGTGTHSSNTPNGTYTSDIGETTIKAICNDPAGFSIYASGYTGGKTGQENSNKLVGLSTGLTIETGTATSVGDPDTSNWAMKLTTDSSAAYPIVLATGYDDYHEVPNYYTKVAARLTATDIGTGATGSTITTTYAIYVSKSQPADTYVGQVKYLLINPHSDTPPDPGTFEAAYLDAGKTKYKGYYKMQDINDTICANVDNYGTGTLIDTRDDSTYTVAKLAGACWMTQNLRITGTIFSEGSNFSTHDNVNVCEGDLTSGSSYSEARCHDSENTTNGVWYNYAAASAKTITAGSTYTVATEDICPAGWHLPTYESATTPGSIRSLTSSATIRNVFSPVAGGSYSNGSPSNISNGYWWSTTAGSNVSRYTLNYNGSALSTTTNFSGRGNGNYIRCTR